MPQPARRGALACALLASTAIASPALAQTSQPSIYQNIDANGVDLTDGSFNFALQEGSIGSGEGAISLMRYQGAGGASDNLSVRFTRTVSGTTALIVLTFGNRREEFSGPSSATSFSSNQGNGAFVTKIDASHYRYTASDGSVTEYGPPPLLTAAANSTFCRVGAEASCELIVSQIRRPNGATTTFQWDVGENCVDYSYCDQFWRQRGLTNNSGYRLRFRFQTEANPASGAPGQTWFERAGADLFNDAVPGAGVRTITYQTPSAGVTDITTDGGATWRITRDSNNRIVGVRRPGSASDDVTVIYNTRFVDSVISDGITTSYMTVTNPLNGMTYVIVTNALNQKVRVTSVTGSGRPTSIVDGLNRTTSIQYDANDRPTRVTQPEGNYTELTYDLRGNVVQTQAVPKPGSSEATITTSATYAATCTNVVTCNLPTSTTDARGNVTDYTYDPTHGGVTSVTAPAVTVGNASLRPQVRTTYTQIAGIHLPTAVSTCQTGASCTNTADEVRTTTTYGTNHLPTGVSAGNGAGTLTATQAMTWDSAGNLLTVDGPLSGSADTVRYRYNSARRRVGTVAPDPDGAGALPHRATRITYRPDGQVSRTEVGVVNSQSDSDWAAMTVLEQVDVSYDSNNRPIAQSHAASGQMYGVTQTSYDAVGRPECNAVRMNPATWSALPASACTPAATGTHGPDRISRNVYDAAGQVTQVQTAVGTALAAAEVTATYSANGQPLTVTDGESNRTSYEYDGHDRLRRTYFPLAAQGSNNSNSADYEELGYDAAGNVVSRRNRAGDTANYTLDALGRIVLKDLPGSEPDVTYQYDLLGRLTSASQTGHAVTFTYDALGRRLTQTNPMGTIGSTWDLAGRRTRITHPGGYYVDQDYLVTGEIAAIRENGATSGLGVIATFGYDTLGRRTSMTRGNGTVTTYAYDPASRLQTLTQDIAGTTYDLTLGFTYNPAGQIVSNTRSNDAYSFVPALGITTTQVNGLNQITANGGISATYDARGNITAEGGRTFSYSSENLLTGFTGHGRTMGFTYDPLMRAYGMTTVGLNPRTFLHDGDDVIVQNMSGNFLVRYVYGPGSDEPLYSLNSSGTRSWLHADERGSIVASSDSSGVSAAPTTYDEYGNPSAWAGNHGFAGTLFLGLSQLYYNRARIYDPSLGRFLQTDPIGYGAGMNVYAYVGGDPVNETDPSGLCPFGADPCIVEGKRLGPSPMHMPGAEPSCQNSLFPILLCNGGGAGGGSSEGGDGGGAPGEETEETAEANRRDIRICNSLPDPAARSRCYQSANRRDYQRRWGKPVEDLETRRDIVERGVAPIRSIPMPNPRCLRLRHPVLIAACGIISR